MRHPLHGVVILYRIQQNKIVIGTQTDPVLFQCGKGKGKKKKKLTWGKKKTFREIKEDLATLGAKTIRLKRLSETEETE